MHSHGNQGDSQSSSQNAQDPRPLGSAAGIDARPILGVALGVVAACLLASIFLVDVPVSPAPQTVFAQSGPRVMAIQSSTQPDVVNVTGEGFTPGERVGIYVEPVSAEKTIASSQPSIKVMEAIVDSMGHIYSLLTVGELQQAPYAQAYVSIHTLNGQYLAANILNLLDISTNTAPPSMPSLFAPTTDGGEWLRETFSDPTLSGDAYAPAFVGDVACATNQAISADIPASARWTQQFRVPHFANYAFTVTTLGGTRLYVDDKPLVDAWYERNTRSTYRKQTHLSKGMHKLRLEYVKFRATCNITLDVQPYYPNWHANVFDNDTLDGPMLAELDIDSDPKSDATLDLKSLVDSNKSLQVDWESDVRAAEVKVDHFSANIIRTIRFAKRGKYKLTLKINERDQARLLINRQPVTELGEWSEQRERTTTYFFGSQKDYFVQLQFIDINGPASVQLIFEPVQDVAQP